MLIGPIITLEKLEKHMNDRAFEIKMELPKLSKKFSELQDDFKRMPRTVYETKNEEEVEVANPDFIRIPDEMKKIELLIKDFQEQLDFIEAKLKELETIEERSKGKNNINKETYKITLTLNDCLKLGIDDPSKETEQVN